MKKYSINAARARINVISAGKRRGAPTARLSGILMHPYEGGGNPCCTLYSLDIVIFRNEASVLNEDILRVVGRVAELNEVESVLFCNAV